MSRVTEIVVGTPSGPGDDLALPRPPGVLRRFWAAHPRVTDGAVIGVVALVTLPVPFLAASDLDPPLAAWTIALNVVAVASLALRRRMPIVVLAVAALPSLVLPPSMASVTHPLLGAAVYAIAVYRSVRAAWVSVAVVVAIIAAATVIAGLMGTVTVAIGIPIVATATMMLLIGALLGANIGNRRRYTEALIDRSRQLAVERDQQGELAAAAERTRIAREMHDIVSHALTVVVALSEGAAAAGSLDRARDASRAAADTARAALAEMRAMLGVLRDAQDEGSPLEPLVPVDPVRVAETAQRAGYPVVLTTNGSFESLPLPVRFAVGRVVQEGLTNAMRHAPGAAAIDVGIRTHPRTVTVTIDNDGAPATERAGGFGLRGLRERVEHVGGSLTAGPVPPSRWRLVAEVPLAPDDPTGERS